MARPSSLSLLSLLFFSLSGLVSTPIVRGDEGRAGSPAPSRTGGGRAEDEGVDTGRPTSGTLSILSGRTLGVGGTVVAFGGGWPGVYGELDLAPSSTFNVALRGTFVYASPMMGVGAGLGGDLLASARLHLYGRGTFDFSLAARLAGTFGEGTLAGQVGLSPFAHAFGWSARADVGGLAGFELSPGFTLTLGMLVGGGAAHTPDAGSHALFGLATFVAVLGAEVSLSENMFLFFDVEGGGAVANDLAFDSHAIIRVYGGVAFAP